LVAVFSMVEIAQETEVVEGKAKIVSSSAEDVFYNPVQVTNRDLSICVIQAFEKRFREESEAKWHRRVKRKTEEAKQKGEVYKEEGMFFYKGLRIFEALSGTGIRSIRYFKELEDTSDTIPAVESIIVNDLDPKAVMEIKRNLERNNIPPDKVQACEGDCSVVMASHRHRRSHILPDPKPIPGRLHSRRFHVVDLDPYGTASPFLDSAVQALEENGLLLVTCTDSQCLCGHYPEVCFSKYGSICLHSTHSHEMAIRIVLQSIAKHAARYKKIIIPLLSLSIDFYIRVFVRVKTSAQGTKQLPTKLSLVFNCNKCHSWRLQPLARMNRKGKYQPPLALVQCTCEQCGGTYVIGGPIWNAPLHNVQFLKEVNDMLSENKHKSFRKIRGLLSVAETELQDQPLYWSYPDICKTLRIHSPSPKLVYSALLNAGYRVSQTHCSDMGFKTDAPQKVVWDCFRALVKKFPRKGSALPNSAGDKILAKEPELEFDFKINPGSNFKLEVPRFVPNPPNWGPKSKAGGSGRGRKRKKNNDKDQPKKSKQRT